MSTIMNALRKVEDQKNAAAKAADPGRLDRQIVADETPARSGGVRRVVVVSGAVVASGLAGVGLTLLALSLWQANEIEASEDAAPAAVSAPAAVQVASTEPTEPAVAEDDATATPPVSAPVSTRNVDDPEAMKRLRARREARLSRMPSRSAEAQATAPVATEPEPQPAKIDAAAPAPASPKTQATVDRRPANEIAEHQRAETLAIEAELAKLESAEEEASTATEDRLEAIPTPAREEVEEVVAAEPAVVEVVAEPEAVAIEDVAPADPVEAEEENAIATDPNAIPRFAIKGTTWHPHRQRRTAVVEVEEMGETRRLEVREGQRVGPMKVSEIGPTGVTLFHEGKEIRRRIGAGLR